MISLERTLFEYFERTKNYIRVQPLNLGGIAGSGGGSGGPPGGFIGQLPQSKVCYDIDELETNYTPSSGTSIVDNLNHIRYRVAQLEATSSGIGTGRISIYDNGIFLSSGITSLNFYGELNVVASGSYAVIEHPQLGSDYFDIVVPTSGFNTTKIFIANTLKIYYDGLRVFNTDYAEGPFYNAFTTTFAVASGSKIVADYLYYQSIQTSGGAGWGALWGSMPWGA